MVVLPEMLVADWHLASSELGSSRIPTLWQDLAHSTTQICHTECATQWFATHTRCRARSFSGDAHCTNMTHSLLATNLWKCFVETTEYIMYHKHQDIYHKEMYALHPTTGRPTQQVQSWAELYYHHVVARGHHRSALSPSMSWSKSHCPPVPMFPGDLGRILHQSTLRLDLWELYCWSQSFGLTINLRKKILVVLLCEAASLFTTLNTFF